MNPTRRITNQTVRLAFDESSHLSQKNHMQTSNEKKPIAPVAPANASKSFFSGLSLLRSISLYRIYIAWAVKTAAIPRSIAVVRL